MGNFNPIRLQISNNIFNFVIQLHYKPYKFHDVMKNKVLLICLSLLISLGVSAQKLHDLYR